MMCSKILNKSISEKPFVKKVDKFFENFKNKYRAILKNVLEQKNVAALFALGILLLCFFLAVTTNSELAPDEDQSVLFISATAPQSANLSFLTKYTNQLNAIFKDIPETQDYFIINGNGGENNAISGLILKPWGERNKSQAKVHAMLQEKLTHIAGLNIASFPLPSIPGNNDGLPIQFVLTSTADYIVLNEAITKLKDTAQKSGLFLFLDSNLKFEKPELQININRDLAGSMGVKMQDIGGVLSTLLSENYINRFSKEGESYKVIPELFSELRFNPENLRIYYVPVNTSDAAEMVPLSTFINYHFETKPNSLNSFQQLNSATLEGLPSPGRSIVECLNYLSRQAKAILSSEVSFDYAGQSRQAIQEGNALMYTFFFALIIIYLVLSAQFESFRDPFIVLVSVPMSIAGALIPLNLGLATLNIYTGIGLVTLIGLISKHGILMVDFANKLQVKEKLSIHDAIIKAASLRLRPILMTTSSMVLGVLPLILASGAGAASRFDIGLVIASGMLIGTCFTLFIVPTMYSYIAKDHNQLLK